MANNNDKNSNVQSIERALLLLEALSQHSSGCSIKQLAELTGLNKSTIHRILHTLLTFGYVRQNPKTDDYHLGFQILNLSNHLMEEFDIVSIAKPYIKKACDETGLVIQLSTRNNDSAVFLDKVENPNQNVRMYSKVGRSIPLYCSSSGKALLAWNEPEEILHTVNSTNYQAFTQYTIPDSTAFLQEIDVIQKKGYAIDFFEHEITVCCAAAPIINSSRKTVAAVCFAGTFLQINASNLPDYIRKIHETAKNISAQLGCTSYPAHLNPDMLTSDAVRYNERVQEIIQQFQSS